jgi:hypothetical protein
MNCVEYLDPNHEGLRERIEDTLEGLTVVGDLLELSQVTIDDAGIKSTWLFAAPPAFVRRKDQSVLILGSAPDKPLPLPDAFAKRVSFARYARILIPDPNEDLPQELADFGFCELSENTWLRAPKEQTPEKVVEHFTHKLAAQLPSGEVENLELIDPDAPTRFYKGRWRRPGNLSGQFVARRPQQYGAPLWGFAFLARGHLTKFLDFPGSAKSRGCDQAWYLQMAIDRARNNLHVYRVVRIPDGTILQFFSPIPLWARRRFETFGKPAAQTKCLFSYFVPQEFAQAEQEFLRKRLWMMPVNGQDN